MLTTALHPSGFDTVSTALSWSIMYMAAYPEIHERLYQELSKQVFLIRHASPGSPTARRKTLTDVQLLLLKTHSPGLSLQTEMWIRAGNLVSQIGRIYQFWRPSSWKSFVTLLSCLSRSLIGTVDVFIDV